MFNVFHPLLKKLSWQVVNIGPARRNKNVQLQNSEQDLCNLGKFLSSLKHSQLVLISIISLTTSD